MLPYYNDQYMKFEYDPQNNKFAFMRQAVGAQGAIDIDVASFTPSNTNSVFVSNTTGNDSTGNGNQATPYKTLLHAANLCTATRIYVVVLDSALYAEDLATLNNAYFSGIYAITGQTPTYTLRTLGYTPSDSNTIYVASSLADSSADGTVAHPVATIAAARALCDSTHQSILINDSETYTEAGWEFTGNVKNLYAGLGCTPTIKPTQDFSLIDYDQGTKLIDEKVLPQTVAFTDILDQRVLSNGNIVTTFLNSSHGYFIITNTTNSIVVDATSVDSTTTGLFFQVAVFTDKFAVCYENDTTLYFKIFNNDGTVSVPRVTISDFYGTFSVVTGFKCIENGNNFIISAVKARNDVNWTYWGKFYIYDISGNIIDSTEFESVGYGVQYYYCGMHNVCTLSSGDYLLQYFKSDATIVLRISAAGTITTTTTLIAEYSYSGHVIPLDSNGYLCVYNFYFKLFNASDVLQGSQTQYTADTITAIAAAHLDNDTVMIGWIASNDNYNVTYCIIDNTGSEVKTDTELCDWGSSGSTFNMLFNVIDNGTVLYNIIDQDDSDKVKYGIFAPYGNPLLKFSQDGVINGIIIDADDILNCNAIIDIDAYTVTSKFCEFLNNTNGSGLQNGWAIYGTGVLTAQNNSIHDGHSGIYAATNTATVKNNEFYRLSGGYACHIVGAGGTGQTIQVTHNTFFNNYAGLQLENNDGNELVKNNIFHDNNVYGILAETGITISYTLYTDTMSGVTNGTSVILANPLFVNEGALDSDDTDLKIKLRVLGYPADSPAYQLADDTSPDRDAGAWDIIAIGAATTWTSFTVEKPATGIKVTHEPINALVNKHKNGSLQTSYDGWAEVVEITFEGIKNADYANFMLMLNCGESQIRCYPDSITYTTSFNLYNLIYDAVNSYAKMYKLTRTGIQDFTVKFARSYEP